MELEEIVSEVVPVLLKVCVDVNAFIITSDESICVKAERFRAWDSSRGVSAIKAECTM